ncbi:MAG: M28 family peptidase [Candidatus Sericytochromatia bacterium]
MKKDSNKKITTIIYEIQENIGNRPTATSDEKIAHRYIKNIFEEYTDNIIFEPFKCNPRSEQHEILLFCVIYCLALLGYIFYPLFAPFILIIYFINFGIIKFFDIRFTDIFAKKSTSHNLIAKFMSKNELPPETPEQSSEVFSNKNKNLIFTANIDSPYISKIYGNNLRKYYLKIKEYFHISFYIFFIISLIKVLNIIPFFDDYIYLLPFLLIGFIAFFYEINISYEKSFGANNNMSGTAILVALAEELKKIELKNINVYLCLFGAKNANSAGSKFFVNKYFKDLTNSEVINLTSLSGDNLFLITRENDYKINNNLNLVNKIQKIAENINIKLYRSHININTDSAPFSYEKIPSTTITSLDQDLIPLRYNIKDDLPQYIKEEQLIKVFDICRELIRVKNV